LASLPQFSSISVWNWSLKAAFFAFFRSVFQDATMMRVRWCKNGGHAGFRRPGGTLAILLRCLAAATRGKAPMAIRAFGENLQIAMARSEIVAK
jgi:hypothetical protein